MAEVVNAGRTFKVWDGDDRPPSTLNPSVPACHAWKTDRSAHCTNPAMWNGIKYTRCQMHGGRSTGPLKHGQHHRLVGRRIFEMAEALENDQGLTAIEDQVKLGAAALAEYMRSLEKMELEWLDPDSLDRLLDRIEKVSKLIERRHKIREGQLYTVRTEHFVLVVHAVAEAINDELADYPDLRDRLARRIGKIRVIEGDAKRLPASQNA